MDENENYHWREPRVPGSINWYGLWTLYKKEVYRFIKIFFQTIAAPIATSLLFMAIFTIALGDLRPDVNGAPFIEFLAPGLIMMSVLQQAFAHTSSSLLISKIQGNIVDILLPPLGEIELNAAISLGGVTRGVIVAVGAILCMSFFVNFNFVDIWAIFFYLISGSLMLSSIGIITGIWAEKFDHLGTVTNFIIVPLSFLSGTFYSIQSLPRFLKELSYYNPFFHMIDGFRYSFIGKMDGSIKFGIIYLLILNFVMWFISYYLYKKGYKIKS